MKQNKEKNGCSSLETLGDHLSATFPASDHTDTGLRSQPKFLTAANNAASNC